MISRVDKSAPVALKVNSSSPAAWLPSITNPRSYIFTSAHNSIVRYEWLSLWLSEQISDVDRILFYDRLDNFSERPVPAVYWCPRILLSDERLPGIVVSFPSPNASNWVKI
jgi:hypothetical protein